MMSLKEMMIRISRTSGVIYFMNDYDRWKAILL
jgi:hypothetical protein